MSQGKGDAMVNIPTKMLIHAGNILFLIYALFSMAFFCVTIEQKYKEKTVGIYSPLNGTTFSFLS